MEKGMKFSIVYPWQHDMEIKVEHLSLIDLKYLWRTLNSSNSEVCQKLASEINKEAILKFKDAWLEHFI